MFRDSRGVVHTVSAPEPLTDVPPAAASALARALLVPWHGDLGSALERCEAVTALLGRWQDAFFAALPSDYDADEERRYAEEAGLDYDEVSGDWEDDLDELDPELDDPFEDDPPLSEEDVVDLDDARFLSHADDPATAGLDDRLVSELERELLLLPMRTRLEALIGAELVVQEWTELLADHEKCLGHLVLTHDLVPDVRGHEELVDLHAHLHAGTAEHGS